MTYDPTVISYEQLLDVFWRNVDPFDGGGRFCDRGASYRPGIFYMTDAQELAAQKSKEAVQQKLDAAIVGSIIEAKAFYFAEEYPQKYY